MRVLAFLAAVLFSTLLSGCVHGRQIHSGDPVAFDGCQVTRRSADGKALDCYCGRIGPVYKVDAKTGTEHVRCEGDKKP